MFIWNVKLNMKLITKIVFAVIFLIVVAILLFSGKKIFGSEMLTNKQNVSDKLNLPDISVVDTYNYTNVLKTVHDNLSSYIGQKINLTGYVYMVSDINNDEFIIARDMIISSDNQSVVVRVFM